jgi:hypothetical protein
VQSLLYSATNTDLPRLNDFLGVSQITAPDQIYHWRARTNFLPLITAGQKPIFADDAATLRALAAPDFDGNKVVFLPPDAKRFITVSHETAARVLDSHFENQTVDADVTAAEPSLVVIAQTYYTNWRAFVDGQPAPLCRANDAFQAVPVPAGRHHIRLAYVDWAFRVGAMVSLVTLMACLAGWMRMAKAVPAK